MPLLFPVVRVINIGQDGFHDIRGGRYKAKNVRTKTGVKEGKGEKKKQGRSEEKKGKKKREGGH